MWIVVHKFVGANARPRWRIVENEHAWVDNTVTHREHVAAMNRSLARARDLNNANPDAHFRAATMFRWPVGEVLPEPVQHTPDVYLYGPVRQPVVGRHGPYPALP